MTDDERTLMRKSPAVVKQIALAGVSSRINAIRLATQTLLDRAGELDYQAIALAPSQKEERTLLEKIAIELRSLAATIERL
jgi:predicted CoA-binding protein